MQVTLFAGGGNNDGVAKVCNRMDRHAYVVHAWYLSLFLFTSEVNLNRKKTLNILNLVYIL